MREGLESGAAAVALARAGANPFRESIALTSYAMLLGLSGDFDQAFALLNRVDELCQRHNYRSLRSEVLRNVAELRLRRGDLPDAIGRFTELLDIAGTGEPQLARDLHLLLSVAYEQNHDFENALRHSREHHRSDQLLQSQQAATRARVLTHRFELYNAQLEADKARVEAALERLRSAKLEAEKQLPQVRTIELGRYAQEDPLTGLSNRRHMDDQLPGILAAARYSRRPLCVAVGDVDRFKGVNDEFGHPTGDLVLKRLGGILRGGCRPEDLVARIGGDEFFLALIDVGLEAAHSTCERLRAAVQGYDWNTIKPGLGVTISFGVVQLCDDPDALALLSRADGRLYDAKRNGRNRVEPGIDISAGRPVMPE